MASTENPPKDLASLLSIGLICKELLAKLNTADIGCLRGASSSVCGAVDVHTQTLWLCPTALARIVLADRFRHTQRNEDSQTPAPYTSSITRALQKWPGLRFVWVRSSDGKPLSAWHLHALIQEAFIHGKSIVDLGVMPSFKPSSPPTVASAAGPVQAVMHMLTCLRWSDSEDSKCTSVHSSVAATTNSPPSQYAKSWLPSGPLQQVYGPPDNVDWALLAGLCEQAMCGNVDFNLHSLINLLQARLNAVVSKPLPQRVTYGIAFDGFRLTIQPSIKREALPPDVQPAAAPHQPMGQPNWMPTMEERSALQKHIWTAIACASELRGLGLWLAYEAARLRRSAKALGIQGSAEECTAMAQHALSMRDHALAVARLLSAHSFQPSFRACAWDIACAVALLELQAAMARCSSAGAKEGADKEQLASAVVHSARALADVGVTVSCKLLPPQLSSGDGNVDGSGDSNGSEGGGDDDGDGDIQYDEDGHATVCIPFAPFDRTLLRVTGHAHCPVVIAVLLTAALKVGEPPSREDAVVTHGSGAGGTGIDPQLSAVWAAVSALGIETAHDSSSAAAGHANPAHSLPAHLENDTDPFIHQHLLLAPMALDAASSADEAADDDSGDGSDDTIALAALKTKLAPAREFMNVLVCLSESHMGGALHSAETLHQDYSWQRLGQGNNGTSTPGIAQAAWEHILASQGWTLSVSLDTGIVHTYYASMAASAQLPDDIAFINSRGSVDKRCIEFQPTRGPPGQWLIPTAPAAALVAAKKVVTLFQRPDDNPSLPPPLDRALQSIAFIHALNDALNGLNKDEPTWCYDSNLPAVPLLMATMHAQGAMQNHTTVHGGLAVAMQLFGLPRMMLSPRVLQEFALRNFRLHPHGEEGALGLLELARTAPVLLDMPNTSISAFSNSGSMSSSDSCNGGKSFTGSSSRGAMLWHADLQCMLTSALTAVYKCEPVRSSRGKYLHAELSCILASCIASLHPDANSCMDMINTVVQSFILEEEKPRKQLWVLDVGESVGARGPPAFKCMDWMPHAAAAIMALLRGRVQLAVQLVQTHVPVAMRAQWMGPALAVAAVRYISALRAQSMQRGQVVTQPASVSAAGAGALSAVQPITAAAVAAAVAARAHATAPTSLHAWHLHALTLLHGLQEVLSVDVSGHVKVRTAVQRTSLWLLPGQRRCYKAEWAAVVEELQAAAKKAAAAGMSSAADGVMLTEVLSMYLSFQGSMRWAAM